MIRTIEFYLKGNVWTLAAYKRGNRVSNRCHSATPATIMRVWSAVNGGSLHIVAGNPYLGSAARWVRIERKSDNA